MTARMSTKKVQMAALRAIFTNEIHYGCQINETITKLALTAMYKGKTCALADPRMANQLRMPNCELFEQTYYTMTAR